VQFIFPGAGPNLKFFTDWSSELFFNEHIDEVQERSFQTTYLVCLLMLLAFLTMQPIVAFLQAPVGNIKFFQLSPGDYFLSTLNIAFYTGLIFALPLILSQVLFFFSPSLTWDEKNLISGLIIFSVILLSLGLLFSYEILIPAALTFFISYNSAAIEPLWAFNEYFGFMVVLFFGTSLVFQVPILQIVLCLFRLINAKAMLSCWRYMILFSTIIGAILTPSADPITQLLLSTALFILYLTGCFLSISLTKEIKFV
jgi:sec-independent protein translocase protein TatC